MNASSARARRPRSGHSETYTGSSSNARTSAATAAGIRLRSRGVGPIVAGRYRGGSRQPPVSPR